MTLPRKRRIIEGMTENIGDTGTAAAVVNVAYRGPFDYIQYNWDILPRATANDPRKGEAQLVGNEQVIVNANGYSVVDARMLLA